MDGLHYMLPVAGKSANERKRVTIAHLSRDQRQGRGVRTHELTCLGATNLVNVTQCSTLSGTPAVTNK